jgi:undecaprenyl diphosphate synthase
MSFPHIPKHIAIIMDGNGRWARRRQLPRIAGHKAGARSVREIVKVAAEQKICALTLFAFSSENWGRPKAEVKFLLDLLLNTLQEETDKLHENNIQLRFIGDMTPLNSRLQQHIHDSQLLTANNSGLKLTIAINYSGRWDIQQGVQALVNRALAGNLTGTITPELINASLCLGDLPEPDLFIRTSGESRLSNFLLWQLAYTELYFTDTLWPDFDRTAFEHALAFYATRERRFGLVTEAVE